MSEPASPPRPDWGRILAHYFLIAVAASILVLLGVVGARVLGVQRGLNAALRLISARDPASAIVELRRLEEDAALHPMLLRRLDVLAVKALAMLGEDAAADRLANETKRRSEEPRRLPEDFWQAIYAIPDPLVCATVERLNGGRPVSGSAGIEVLAAERKLRAESPLPRVVARPSPRPPAPAPAAAPRPGQTAQALALPAEEDPEAARITTAPSSAAQTQSWAFVVTLDANAYDLSGAFLRRLEPGTVLEVSDFRSSSTGRVALCTGMNTAKLGAPILLRERDVELTGRNPALLPADERDLRVRRAKILAEVDRLRRNPCAANPHYAAYHAARAAYTAFWRKADSLEKRMNAATGDARMRIHDELRKMKGEDERLLRTVEDAKKSFDAWTAANPESGLKSAAGRALQADLAQIQERLGRLAAATP